MRRAGLKTKNTKKGNGSRRRVCVERVEVVCARQYTTVDKPNHPSRSRSRFAFAFFFETVVRCERRFFVFLLRRETMHLVSSHPFFNAVRFRRFRQSSRGHHTEPPRYHGYFCSRRQRRRQRRRRVRGDDNRRIARRFIAVVPSTHRRARHTHPPSRATREARKKHARCFRGG